MNPLEYVKQMARAQLILLGRDLPPGEHLDEVVMARGDEVEPLALHLDIFNVALITNTNFRAMCARIIAQKRHSETPRLAVVLGVSDRADCVDTEQSFGLSIAKYLRNTFGIDIVVHDPLWTPSELKNFTGLQVLPRVQLVSNYSTVVLATIHDDYSPDLFIKGQVLVDVRAAWRDHEELFQQRGVEYWYPGKPGWWP